MNLGSQWKLITPTAISRMRMPSRNMNGAVSGKDSCEILERYDRHRKLLKLENTNHLKI